MRQDSPLSTVKADKWCHFELGKQTFTFIKTITLTILTSNLVKSLKIHILNDIGNPFCLNFHINNITNII